MKKKTLIIAIVVIAVLAIVLALVLTKDKEKEIGSGKTTVYIDVVQKDGATHKYICHTDADNLQDVLLETGFVEGEIAQYGLYIKKVEGVVADYDIDASYWALKKDGEDMMTGAGDEKIADGNHYSLVYTK